MIRTPDLRRSILFVGGADPQAQARALQARPDVLVQDLEDFTPVQSKEAARQRAAHLYAAARARAVMVAVRINPLDDIGAADLAAVIPARPELIFLPKCESGAQIAALAGELQRLEAQHGFTPGELEIVPNVETARGVVNLREIVQASPRVRSCLLATEDLAADLSAERSPDAIELAYARSRFLLESRALGIEPIDAPYTYSDVEGCERESRRSRQLGYRSKSLVGPDHVAAVNRVLTPSGEEVARAEQICAAFEAARERGEDRPEVDGQWIEPPAYRNAQRLLQRARQLAAAEQSPDEPPDGGSNA